MNHYEILAIITHTVADTDVPAAIVRIEETLKKHGCAIHYSQNLERRRLAYPIDHQQYGSYILIEFDCASEYVGKLEHDFQLTSELLRHVIVRRSHIGKPRPLFKEMETPLMRDKRALRKEIKTVTLDEALQTVEQETQEAQKIQSALEETSGQTLREKEPLSKENSGAGGIQPETKPALSDEDLEKKLNEKLAEILRDGI